MHVIASVAWVGASLCLVVLGLTGLLAEDPLTRRSAYVALGAVAGTVALPVSLAAFASGVLIALGTRWRLFRHWWVLVSLIATGVMTAAVAFALTPMMRSTAARALTAPANRIAEAVGPDAIAVVVAPSVAVVALSAVTALNVFKPRGRVTPDRKAP